MNYLIICLMVNKKIAIHASNRTFNIKSQTKRKHQQIWEIIIIKKIKQKKNVPCHQTRM